MNRHNVAGACSRPRKRRSAVVTMIFAAVAATAAVSAGVALAAGGQTVSFQGTARDDEGHVVYVENHTLWYDGDRLLEAETRYVDASGTLIATLDSDYARSQVLPAYHFHDHRTGKVEGLRWDGDEVVLYRQKRAGDELKEKRFEPRASHVGGQGFNNLVLDHLAELERGDEVEFHFLIPDRLDDYRLRVKAVGGEDDAESSLIQLKCELDNWFLRLIAPSLEISYERDSGRLVAYEGNSNLADERGGAMRVRIDYDYDTEVAQGSATETDG